MTTVKFKLELDLMSRYVVLYRRG